MTSAVVLPVHAPPVAGEVRQEQEIPLSHTASRAQARFRWGRSVCDVSTSCNARLRSTWFLKVQPGGPTKLHALSQSRIDLELSSRLAHIFPYSTVALGP